MKTITRFAPSPTGLLHLGGIRTALFNFLHAKSSGGKFKIRIEDTDQTRNKKESIDSIFKGLDWLALNMMVKLFIRVIISKNTRKLLIN